MKQSVSEEAVHERVTLLQVAKDAGVSRATASLVLRGSELVAEKTRERVLASMQKLGYVYHRGAADLRTQHSQTVGLIIPDVTNPFFAELTVGVEAQLDLAHHVALLGNTAELLSKQDRLLSTIREYRAGGVLLCGAEGTSAEIVARMRSWGLPFVLFVRYVTGVVADYVGPDNVRGAELAVEHLIAHGHRRIAFVGGPAHSSARYDRLQGYRNALRRHGLPSEAFPDLVSPTSRDGGYQVIQPLLAQPDPPTAVLCYNDIVAFGVMLGVQAQGRAVGQDIAVIGFDDIAEAALWRPALTTVAIEPRRIGEAAAQLLLERIAHPDDPPRQIILPPRLVIRESCGAHGGTSTMNSTKPLGWGVIGTSDVARTRMLEAINTQPDSRVVAVMSSSAERARQYAAETGIPRAYDSLDAILADPEIDVVYISTTNDLHRDQTLAAAHAGKHVLCEKPLALTVEDARMMVATCAKANVVLGTNHHLRNAATHRTLRRLIAEGVIGRPLQARVFHAVYLPPRLQGWRVNRPQAGAGVILDITVHDADTLRFVLDDEVEEVTALSSQQGLASGTLEDMVMGVMHFRNGVVAQFHDAFTIPHAGTGFEVHGTEGSLFGEGVMTQDPVGRIVLRRGEAVEEIDVGEREDLYVRSVRQFNQAVRGVGQPSASGEDGVRSLAIALAVQESARSGRRTSVQYE